MKLFACYSCQIAFTCLPLLTIREYKSKGSDVSPYSIPHLTQNTHEYPHLPQIFDSSLFSHSLPYFKPQCTPSGLCGQKRWCHAQYLIVNPNPDQPIHLPSTDLHNSKACQIKLILNPRKWRFHFSLDHLGKIGTILWTIKGRCKHLGLISSNLSIILLGREQVPIPICMLSSYRLTWDYLSKGTVLPIIKTFGLSSLQASTVTIEFTWLSIQKESMSSNRLTNYRVICIIDLSKEFVPLEIDHLWPGGMDGVWTKD